jgi:hypothetical protein
VKTCWNAACGWDRCFGSCDGTVLAMVSAKVTESTVARFMISSCGFAGKWSVQ